MCVCVCVRAQGFVCVLNPRHTGQHNLLGEAVCVNKLKMMGLRIWREGSIQGHLLLLKDSGVEEFPLCMFASLMKH